MRDIDLKTWHDAAQYRKYVRYYTLHPTERFLFSVFCLYPPTPSQYIRICPGMAFAGYIAENGANFEVLVLFFVANVGSEGHLIFAWWSNCILMTVIALQHFVVNLTSWILRTLYFQQDDHVSTSSHKQRFLLDHFDRPISSSIDNADTLHIVVKLIMQQLKGRSIWFWNQWRLWHPNIIRSWW